MTRLLVTASALSFAFLSRPSLAACPPVQPAVSTLAPVDGASGVPVNAVVAFGTAPVFGGYDPVVVLSSGGGAIPGALIAGPADSWLFRPDDDLQPGTTYTATISDAAGIGAGAQAAFTTGSASDTTDPALPFAPTLSLAEYVPPTRTDDCLRPGYWNVQVDWDPATDDSALIYSVEVVVDDLVPTDFAPIAQAIATSSTELLVQVPEVSRAAISVYAIDAAGRQGHSPTAVIDTPQAPVGASSSGCACRLGAGSAGTAGAAATGGMLLLAVALRRRRG